MKPPLGLWITTDHPQTRAGGVQQDPIKLLPLQVVDSKCIANQGLQTGNSQAAGVLLDLADLALVQVSGQHQPLIKHQLSQMGCLAPRCGTDIQHPFTRLRVQQLPDQLGRLILDNKQSLTEPGQVRHEAALQQADPVGGIPAWFGSNTLLGKERQQLLTCRLQGSNPQGQQWRLQRSSGQGDRLLRC